jgi:glucose-6-phosphate isomerase
MPRSRVSLRLYRSPSNVDYERLVSERAVERMQAIDARARQEGRRALDPETDPMISLGMEVSSRGRVKKKSYGVLHLPWLAAEHPEWAAQIEAEVDEIRLGIKKAHGRSLRYIIWAGMGGSAEDKAFYLSAGLLRKRVRVFILDSTDPGKLSAILEEITRLEKAPIEQALRRCLVVGMAMGMTSYEPVVNLEKLDVLYKSAKIDNRANFIYLTLKGSILDAFGSERGFRRIELQLDNGNATAGRHSAPMTRGCLYPLAFNGVDIAAWMKAAELSETEVDDALKLAGFIQANARAGRDKVTLHLPRQWSGGAVWTKQDFEESLGKRQDIGIKVVIHERIRPADYFPPKSASQDRCFLFVCVKDHNNPDSAKISALRRAGYPVAVVQLSGDQPIPHYMQFIHYAVFGLGYLREMNFVTQPGVELYKDYAREINEEAQTKGSIEKTDAWRSVMKADTRLNWMGGLSVDFGPLVRLGLLSEEDIRASHSNPTEVYAKAVESLRQIGAISYGELTYFGDTRYQKSGRLLLKTLDEAAELLFLSRLKMPVDVYEGPAMNHSYHEMIIGFGRGFSTVAIAEQHVSIPSLGYQADYHRAQWLATLKALEDRNRAVVALTIKDSSEKSIKTLKAFFAETAKRVRRRLS